jgi:hypothetical protein
MCRVGVGSFRGVVRSHDAARKELEQSSINC